MAEHFTVGVFGGDATGDVAALEVKAGAALSTVAHHQGVMHGLTIGAGLLRQGATV
ncbi:hypothetical protein ACVBEQ_26775 [Nakamurella sp. GG22]